MKWKINYPELGGVGSKKQFYGEGHELVHPSGKVYVRQNGNWVIKKVEKKIEHSQMDEERE